MIVDEHGRFRVISIAPPGITPLMHPKLEIFLNAKGTATFGFSISVHIGMFLYDRNGPLVADHLFLYIADIGISDFEIQTLQSQ